MSNLVTKNLTIVNTLGLHARAAAKFVKLAVTFSSDIHLTKDGETVNGKSIMDVLLLAAEKGSVVSLQVEGPDHEQAFEALSQLIQSGFGE